MDYGNGFVGMATAVRATLVEPWLSHVRKAAQSLVESFPNATQLEVGYSDDDGVMRLPAWRREEWAKVFAAVREGQIA